MELDFSWLLRPFQRPERRFEPVTRPKPSEIPLRTSGKQYSILSCNVSFPVVSSQAFILCKTSHQSLTGAPIFKGVRSDAEYFEALRTDGGEDERIAMVFYGSSWCTHCERLFPHFVQAAKKNQEMSLKSGTR